MLRRWWMVGNPWSGLRQNSVNTTETRNLPNLEKVLFTGPKTSDTVTFICD